MDDASSLISNFILAFSQENRLFSLHFTQAEFDAELLPHTLAGEEYISRPFKFSIECLCSDVGLELKRLIGQGVDIAIHRPAKQQKLMDKLQGGKS